MNLHEIVAGAIGSVNAHETVRLYANKGISVKDGVVTPVYEMTELRAQVQAPTASDLQQNDRLAAAVHRKRIYIKAPAGTINRYSQTAEDIVQRADGSYWLVVGTTDDFTNEGWLCLLTILQTDPPEGVNTE